VNVKRMLVGGHVLNFYLNFSRIKFLFQQDYCKKVLALLLIINYSYIAMLTVVW
jgi:hypothetical protein